MRMLAEDELRDAVLLVFANKQVGIQFKYKVTAACFKQHYIPSSSDNSELPPFIMH
jgi:hypothetical protein